jgi:hypothetical protein
MAPLQLSTLPIQPMSRSRRNKKFSWPLFFVDVAVIAALAYVAELFIGIYGAAAVAFVGGIVRGGSLWGAFGKGFVAIGLLWLVLFLLSAMPNNFIMADRMAGTMALKSGPWLILAATLLGAVLGGLACLNGFLLKRLF